MSVFLRLAYAFFKIGILTVGGGLAMLPIIQSEMVARGWLTNAQFLDILGIAQMTPGPISVNTATFVGYRVAGDAAPGVWWMALAGALVGTVSVCAPSLVCVNLLGTFWKRHRDHPCMACVFSVLRPLVTGLVMTAAAVLVANSVWGGSLREVVGRAPDWMALAVAAAAFALTAFTKTPPMYVLLGGLAVGALWGWL